MLSFIGLTRWSERYGQPAGRRGSKAGAPVQNAAPRVDAGDPDQRRDAADLERHHFLQPDETAGSDIGREAKIAGIALTLNVALILFGWRQYVDLQHEAELRADGERRAAVLASTDAHTGLLNRKGFADRAWALCQRACLAGQQLAIVSIQINRFKAVNDRHGYEVGDTPAALDRGGDDARA